MYRSVKNNFLLPHGWGWLVQTLKGFSLFGTKCPHLQIWLSSKISFGLGFWNQNMWEGYYGIWCEKTHSVKKSTIFRPFMGGGYGKVKTHFLSFFWNVQIYKEKLLWPSKGGNAPLTIWRENAPIVLYRWESMFWSSKCENPPLLCSLIEFVESRHFFLLSINQ